MTFRALPNLRYTDSCGITGEHAFCCYLCFIIGSLINNILDPFSYAVGTAPYINFSRIYRRNKDACVHWDTCSFKYSHSTLPFSALQRLNGRDKLLRGLLVLINEGNLSCSQVDLSLAEVDNTDCLSEQDGEDLCLQTQDISEGKMKRESTDHRSTNSCHFQIIVSVKVEV